MQKWILAAALIVACGTSYAGNSNGCQGNCPSDGGGATATGGSATGGNGYGGTGYGGDGGNAVGTGVGIGVGLGQGGQGGSGGAGGSAVANGGSGGAVLGSGNSSSVSKNDATAISGSVSGADSDAKSASQSDAKSAATATNGGNMLTGGPTTVGGQAASNTTNVTTRYERNAPPVFLGAITPTSCGGSFNAGGSSRDGAGGLGFSWVGTECAIRQLGDRYQQMGQVDVACNLYASTKAFKKAAKRNPKLRELDCSVKPDPAAVIPQAFLEAHTPRG